jgi:hypothetical protein
MSHAKNNASNETAQIVRFPDAIQQWAAQAERHALDPYLEDVQAQIEQGITDPADDRSVRVVLCPPNERSDGRSVLSVIGSVREAVKETAEKINKGGLYVEPVVIRRPSADAMAQIVTRMHAALPPMLSDADGEASNAALETKVDEAMRSAPPALSREVVRENLRKLRELGHLGDEPVRAGVTEAPAPRGERTVQSTKAAPFVLGIRKGRKVVHEAGPFPKYADAKAALDEWNETAEPGHVTATIYEGGHVAMHHGRAVFERKRTKFQRDS